MYSRLSESCEYVTINKNGSIRGGGGEVGYVEQTNAPINVMLGGGDQRTGGWGL